MRPNVARVMFFAFVWVSLPGADWPEFRGPTGQGLISTGRLPIEWAPSKNVAWKQTIPGVGWSSPVISSERIYLTTAVKSSDELSLRAICVDARTGKIIWDREVFSPTGQAIKRHHAKNSPSSPTPLIHGQHLYVHFGHNGTACLDLEGNIVWQNTELSYKPVHGNGGSPVLVDNALTLAVMGVITASWRRSTERMVDCFGRQTGQSQPSDLFRSALHR